MGRWPRPLETTPRGGPDPQGAQRALRPPLRGPTGSICPPRPRIGQKGQKGPKGLKSTEMALNRQNGLLGPLARPLGGYFQVILELLRILSGNLGIIPVGPLVQILSRGAFCSGNPERRGTKDPPRFRGFTPPPIYPACNFPREKL